MPVLGLRNLLKSALNTTSDYGGNADSTSEVISGCEGDFRKTPFGNAMPRRHEVADELKWVDTKPLQPGSLQYTRLGIEELRLVYLYPGDPSDDIKLGTEICNIHAVSEEYVALSYVWGEPGLTSPIYVDRHRVKATKNLVAALRAMRRMMRKDEICVLWIDAICINQEDNEERSIQVSMMRTIYEQAVAVAAWLGEENGHGLQYIKELGEWYYGRDEDPCSQKRKRDRVEGVKHVKGRYQEMHSAAAVVDNKYWKRVWTVQEYSSPQAGFFMSGDVWMDRVMLSGALTMYIQALRVLQGVMERQGQNASFVDVAVPSVERLRHGELISFLRSSDKNQKTAEMSRYTFFDMLLKFRDLKSTDPRDKIYAPLNLSPDAASLAHSIKVDYSLTTAELYIKVAQHCLTLKHWPLAILENCRLGVSDDLPSWVPDWRSLPRYSLSRDGSTGEQILCAGRNMFPLSQPMSPIVLPGNRLRLEGIHTGALSQVWQPWHSLELKDLTELTIEVDDPLNAYPGSRKTLAEAARTLVSPLEPLEDSVGSTTNLVLAHRQQWRQNRKIVARVNRRRLARTSEGFLGLVPAEAEADDELWLLRGGNLFYVLRRTDSGRRILVGEAFLHGLMHGELGQSPDICQKNHLLPTTVEIE